MNSVRAEYLLSANSGHEHPRGDERTADRRRSRPAAARRRMSLGFTTTHTPSARTARYPVRKCAEIVAPRKSGGERVALPTATARHENPSASGSSHMPHSAVQMPLPRHWKLPCSKPYSVTDETSGEINAVMPAVQRSNRKSRTDQYTHSGQRRDEQVVRPRDGARRSEDRWRSRRRRWAPGSGSGGTARRPNERRGYQPSNTRWPWRNGSRPSAPSRCGRRCRSARRRCGPRRERRTG